MKKIIEDVETQVRQSAGGVQTSTPGHEDIQEGHMTAVQARGPAVTSIPGQEDINSEDMKVVRAQGPVAQEGASPIAVERTKIIKDVRTPGQEDINQKRMKAVRAQSPVAQLCIGEGTCPAAVAPTLKDDAENKVPQCLENIRFHIR
jgi:hypothetical protein